MSRRASVIAAILKNGVYQWGRRDLARIHWEDSSVTQEDGLRLSPNFMWLIDPSGSPENALATISRDPEIYPDNDIHWNITARLIHGKNRKGIAPDFENAKRQVESYFGLPEMPVRHQKNRQ